MKDIHKPYVLLVEDEPLVQFVHKNLLERLGCEVVAASNAMEALELANKKHDFIFLDIGLPDISGIELSYMLRLTLPRSTRFIALTAYTDIDTLKKCLLAGIERVLYKPIDEQALTLLLSKGNTDKEYQSCR
jgi:CheY-like chemotaxis protein